MSPHIRLLILVLAAAGLAWLTLQGFGFVREIRSVFEPGTRWSFQYGSEEGTCITSFREDATIDLNGKEIALEIAQTDTARTRGLSGRSCMPDDVGMLFVFEELDIYPFWMIDMKFPLDMIWISRGVVVEIARDIPPPTRSDGIPVTHVPKVEADMVLELTAGGADRYGLLVGMAVPGLVQPIPQVH